MSFQQGKSKICFLKGKKPLNTKYYATVRLLGQYHFWNKKKNLHLRLLCGNKNQILCAYYYDYQALTIISNQNTDDSAALSK